MLFETQKLMLMNITPDYPFSWFNNKINYKCSKSSLYRMIICMMYIYGKFNIIVVLLKQKRLFSIYRVKLCGFIIP